MIRRLIGFGLALLLAGLAAPGPAAPPQAFAPPVPGSPVVVTLGDSVAAGTACGCAPFPDLYARMLSPRAQSLDLAQSGFTTADVRDQIRTAQVRELLGSATVVLVMIGANDMAEVFGDGDAAYVSAAQKIQTAVAAIVTSVRRDQVPPVPVLVLGYWNVVKDGAVGLATYGAVGLRAAQQATDDGNDALRQAATRSGATYLATGPAFKGVGGSDDPTGLLAADGDHPNAAGHQLIAETIYAAAPTG